MSLLQAQWVDWDHTVKFHPPYGCADKCATLESVLPWIPDQCCRCLFLSGLVNAKISSKRELFGEYDMTENVVNSLDNVVSPQNAPT